MNTPVEHDSRSATRPPEIDEREFRRTLGHFCTGIAVITARDREPIGFTCQSFASLSLDPPLVTFSVANTSRTLPRLLRAGAFSANVLRVGQEPLATRFATSHADRFAEAEWAASPATGTPRLSGALAWVDALVEDAIPGGDHTIVVGRAVALAGGGGDPLLYFAGQFCGGARPLS